MDYDIKVDMHLRRVITHEVTLKDGAYLELKKAIDDAFVLGTSTKETNHSVIVRRVLACLKEQKDLDEVLADSMPEFERFDSWSSSASHFLAYVRGELFLQVALSKESRNARSPPPNINVLLLAGCYHG